MCGSTLKPSRHIALAAVIAAAAQAVASKGDGYKYEKPGTGQTCFYNHKDGLRCIAGEILTVLGVPTPRYFEGETVGSGCSSRSLTVEEKTEKTMNSVGMLPLATWLAEKHNVTFSNEALRFLSVAQRTQDSGKTWGYALAVAMNETK